MAKSTTKKLSKSGIIQAIVNKLGEDTTRKSVKCVLEAVVQIAYKELKKTGLFVLPGFAKFVVVKRAARPAREGINPFTKEKQMFAAKPASKTVRARPIKVIKDAVA